MSRAKYAYRVVLLQYALVKSYGVFKLHTPDSQNPWDYPFLCSSGESFVFLGYHVPGRLSKSFDWLMLLLLLRKK